MRNNESQQSRSLPVPHDFTSFEDEEPCRAQRNNGSFLSLVEDLLTSLNIMDRVRTRKDAMANGRFTVELRKLMMNMAANREGQRIFNLRMINVRSTSKQAILFKN